MTKAFSWAIFLLSAVLVMGMIVFSCVDNSQPQVQVSVQAEQPDLNNSLNLQAIGVQAQKAHSAQELEQMLNDPKTGLNNLDLENNGRVNYINVEEVAQGSSQTALNVHALSGNFLTSMVVATTLPAGSPKVFKLTTTLSNGTVVELARITIQAVSNTQTQIAVTGNQQLYPINNQYQSTVNSADLLLWAYLLAPHPVFYHPYYYYGHYPTYYHYYAPVSRTVYTSRTTHYVSSSPTKYTSTRAATPAMKQAPLSSFSSSQKSFTSRSDNKSVGSGGFGSSSSSSSSKSSSFGSYSSKSSSSSSFGSSSSGSSFSSSSSRSFGGRR